MPLPPRHSIIALTDEEFATLSSFVYSSYGIDLSKKKQLIEGRLNATLKLNGCSNFSEYMTKIKADTTGTLLTVFLNKITTNYSYFARETDHFDFLVSSVLPELEKTRKGDLRIWSAGCSSGQEPYNIAMAIDQYFGFRKQNWDATILATDISSNVLEQAYKATYPADNLKDMSDAWKEMYFDLLSNGHYRVKDNIRKEVVFRIFNLMDKFVYKKPFDIIFCRNVMIYFDSKTTKQLIKKFYDATAEGGYLFIGHSESIDKNSTDYTCICPSVFKKITKKV